MLSQGLSYVIFNASNCEDFEKTLKFYQTLGFKTIADKSHKSHSEERIAWLKLKSADECASEITIKLVLNASAVAQRKPSSDVDWALEESAIVLAVKDLDVSFFFSFIDKIDKKHKNFFFIDSIIKTFKKLLLLYIGCQVKVSGVKRNSTRSYI